MSNPSEQSHAAVQASIRTQQRSQHCFGEVRRDLECFVIRSMPHLTTNSLKRILSPVVALIQIDLVLPTLESGTPQNPAHPTKVSVVLVHVIKSCSADRSMPYLTTNSLKRILSPVVALIQIDLVLPTLESGTPQNPAHPTKVSVVLVHVIKSCSADKSPLT